MKTIILISLLTSPCENGWLRVVFWHDAATYKSYLLLSEIHLEAE